MFEICLCYKLHSACIFTASRPIFTYKLSCAGKPQMKAICTYVECIKATTNNWDIKLLVTIKGLLADISWIAR